MPVSECCLQALNAPAAHVGRYFQAPIGITFACPVCHCQWILDARDKTNGTTWRPASADALQASSAKSGKKSGKKKSLGVDKAVQLRSKGKKWPHIYSSCIPVYRDSTSCSPEERERLRKNLRQAVYNRGKRDLQR